MSRTDDILAALGRVAADSTGYAADWKRRHQRPVVGLMPMNFPPELVHATGALPVVVQDSAVPITLGRGLIFEFYCGYTRSLVDQAATDQLAVFDAILLVDHCVALLGAVDSVRFALPDLPVFLAQFTASMDEPWTRPQVREQIGILCDRLTELVGSAPTAARLRDSIALYNRDRALLRHVYDLRRAGRIGLTAAELQVLVKSAMVMDVAEHVAQLSDLVAVVEADRPPGTGEVRLHFSGHFCHAPPPELLTVIEDCGATVVDDDLYTGYRYIATDVPVGEDPFADLTRWYFDRNTNAPCSTRAQKSVDWERFLLAALAESGADGVVTLMPKFCEPHMLYFPEIKAALLDHQIPHLLIETEHEGLPVESIRVRVEAFIETIKRRASVARELA